MEFRKQRLSLQEARELDMVNYLSQLGHEPSKIVNNNYWYLSPLHQERTASFKIDRMLNRWYDHGIGKGGNLIDFAIEYQDFTIGELLEFLSGNFSFHKTYNQTPEIKEETTSKIKILTDCNLKSTSLFQYLKQRRIDFDIANHHCREVRYEFRNNIYYGIGFKNDLGGYEIRNEYFKTSSSPKAISTFKNGSSQAIVFEGFMDFLSFKTLHKNLPKKQFDFAVLNSLSMFEKARSFMEQHDLNKLYLDRDNAGLKCTEYALSLGDKYTDESYLYKSHKDLNDWLVNFGKP